jgi:hypothetical protein
MHRAWRPIGQCTSAPAASIDMTSSAFARQCGQASGRWRPGTSMPVGSCTARGLAAASDPHGDLTSCAAITRSDTDSITYED